MKNLDEVARVIEKKIVNKRQETKEIAEINVKKVLDAFRKEKVSEAHLLNSTGYGYDDLGRETLDNVYALIFGAEAACVRTQFVSGTHAISTCLFGVLRPNDELIYITGEPYDTLYPVIYGDNNGSLKSLNITCNIVDLEEGSFAFTRIREAITSKTKMIAIQRSKGYSTRPSVTVSAIAEVITFIRNIKSDVVIFVDNCYGEFVESREPTNVGANLIAGSLIKNPGGGIAHTGGYIAGDSKLVELCAGKLTAPGIGSHVGSTTDNLLMYQGLFLAPHVVSESLQGAIFTSCLFGHFGFIVEPGWDDFRTDIVQAISFLNPKKLVSFCQEIQKWSPINSHVTPFPGKIPGFSDEVIMGAGTFIQGSSIELSADGALRPPYTAFMQGGLYYEHVKLAAQKTLVAVLEI